MYVVVYTVVPCLLMPIAMVFMIVVAFLVPLGVASVMHYGQVNAEGGPETRTAMACRGWNGAR